MNKKRWQQIFFLALIILFIPFQAAFALAFPVPELPDDNLIKNPWFRSGNRPSLDGWSDAAGSSIYWSTSQKDSNPSPDNVLGTSARFASGSGQGGGTGAGDVDAYLYQVVTADKAARKLKFKIHWVTGFIDRAAVNIYGGDALDGPWELVWTPLEITQAESSHMAWTETAFLETTIARGYPHYKIELYGRYPSGRQQGVKYTGVYFAVARTDAPVEITAEPLPTTAATEVPRPEIATMEPTAVPPQDTAVSPTDIPEAVAEAVVEPTAVGEDIETTSLDEPDVSPTAVPTASVTAAPSIAINLQTILIVALPILFVVILIAGWLRSRR